MIENGKVVSLSYTLTNDQGEQLDQAHASEPFMYLHGAGQIVPGLETALEGAAKGFKKQVVLQPDDAYGAVVETLKTKVDRSAFPEDLNVEVGMQFRAEVGDQPVIFAVTKMEGSQVYIDGNHPLAGQVLHFDVEVIEVREASAEEKEHGHAHGEGGHSH